MKDSCCHIIDKYCSSKKMVLLEQKKARKLNVKDESED